MRLAAQVQAGYYPASPEAVRHVLRDVSATPGESISILDPCAGEGIAIKAVAEYLGCLPKRVHAIELDQGRVETLRHNLPQARVVGPAAIENCGCSAGSLGLIWLNPPFDDKGDGYGRVEAEFFRQAIGWLKIGGIMVLICPADVVKHRSVEQQIYYHLENVTIIPFPEGHRPFNEVAVIGVRRKDEEYRYAFPAAPAGYKYHVPKTESPKSFGKIAFSDDEWLAMIASSPLRAKFAAAAPKATKKKQPPLALSMGHVGLLLASGQIDGLVRSPGEEPHLVRGTCRKTKYMKSQKIEEKADGKSSCTTVYGERFDLIVRTIDARGVIRNLGGAAAETAETDPAN